MVQARQHGFTFPEITVSVALLGAIFAGSLTIFMNLTPLANSEISLTAMQIKTTSVGDRLIQDLKRCRLDPPSADGTSMVYQIPMDADGDGTLLNGEGEVEWGMTVGEIDTPNATATVEFVPDTLLDENILNADVNGDGDEEDQFDIGSLQLRFSDGSIRDLTGDWVLQPRGDYGGDVDGDLTPDPILSTQVNGEKTLATISLFTVWPTGPARWGRWPFEMSILVRNNQR